MGKSAAASSNQIAKISKPKGAVDRAATPATSPEKIVKVSPKDKSAKAAWARFDRQLKYAPEDLQQYMYIQSHQL